MIEIRSATSKDIEEFYGRKSEKSLRAFAVIRDNEIVCIAGIALGKDMIEAFSDVKEGVTAPKMTIWKVARRIADLLRTTGLPAYASTSKGKFLESMGFTYIGNYENKKLYKL